MLSNSQMNKYYQVILKSGKTHPSLYKTIPNAIKVTFFFTKGISPMQ